MKYSLTQNKKIGGVFNMSQISYSSTSALLSNKFDYPYFSRMVPPDNKQGEALYSIVHYYKWEPYTAAISTADTYGVGGVNSFIQAGNITLLSYQQFYTGFFFFFLFFFFSLLVYLIFIIYIHYYYYF